MSYLRSGLWIGLLALAFADGCKCSTPPLKGTDQCVGVSGAQADMKDACQSSDQCSNHFTCKEPKDKPGVQCCVFIDRSCTTEADCCPGQTCPSDRKKCFDKYLSCETDANCGDTGDSFCEIYSDTYGTSSRCRFHACSALGACPEGQACFQGECMANLPCGGKCSTPGSACVPTINRCQDYASPTGRTDAACPVTCNAGFIATFNDNRNIWDSCTLATVKCVCAELPSLISNDLGRFSAVAVDPGQSLWASSYDGQYGDLVVFQYGLDGVKKKTDYVDGVPTATPTYGPSGARGGVVEPGDDVGRYTDVAVGGGTVYVSYYDVKNGDLKVAIRGADGKWASHKVDGSNGDVGLYTSIGLDSDGNPGVSYFQRAGDTGFNLADCPAPQPTGAKQYVTALKFARATKAVPASDADWTVKTIACMSRPPPPCDACANVCADPGTGPDCFQGGTGCTGCDPNTEACISTAGTSKCAKRYNPSTLVDVPVGVGVFSSLAFNGKEAIIAYMLRNAPVGGKGAADGDLYGVKISAANVPGAPVLLDGTGDTGYFPDVKIDPTTKSIAIGYHDFTSKAFKFYYSANLQVGVTPEIIDNGVTIGTAGDQSWVGTDSSIVFGPSVGQTWAVYQDPTKGDLKIAKRGATWQVLNSLATTGAVGFFADGVFDGTKLYATHARIHAKLVGGEPRVDNALLLETTDGN